MRITSKKTLALLLTVAMLLTCMVFSFSASAAATKMWWNNFEGEGTATSPYKGETANGGQNSGRQNQTKGNYAVVKQDADGNAYMALGFENYAANTAASGFLMTHADQTVKNGTGAGSAGTYTSGSMFVNGKFMLPAGKYAIKLDYRLESISATNAQGVDIALATPASMWWNSDVAVMGGGALTNDRYPTTVIATATKADVGADWKTAICYFDYEGSGAELHLLARRHADAVQDSLTGTEVWVDNIEIYQYEAMSDFPSVSIYYGDQQLHTSTGIPGMAFPTPTLTGLPENAHVTYWADADFTTPATIPTVYPETSQTIYIKTEKYMVNDPWSFETESVDASVSSNGTTFGDYKISDKAAHSGSKSLKLDCSKGFATSTSANTTQFMLKNGSGNYAEIEIGKTYLISYWVMVPETMTTSFENCLWLVADPTKTGSYSFSGNIYNTKERIFRQNSSSYVTVPNDGQWHQIVCKIDGTRIGNVYADKLHGYGKVLVGLSNKVAQEGLSVYVDDMDLICLEDLAAESTELTAYLYKGETAQGATNLHSHTTTKTGIYTSIRLGAKYTAGDSNGDTIMMGGVTLPLSARGIVAGKADMTLNAKGTKGTDYLWSSYKTSGLDQYWTADGNKLSYTLRLANMGKEWFESANEYVWRSCFEVTLPAFYKESAANTLISNEKAVIYGDTSDALTFGAMVENNFTTDYWFTDLS